MRGVAAPWRCALLAALVLSSSVPSTATTPSLTKDTWAELVLGGPGNPTAQRFSYETPNPGQKCPTMADCLDSDRFVHVMAHATSTPLRLTLTMGPEGSTSQSATGTNVGLIAKYGTWSNLYSGGCVQGISRWSPMAAQATVFVEVSLANESDAGTAVSVGVLAHSANVQAPLPGGCASTGDYEYNAMVDFTTPKDTQTAELSFQQSDMGITRDKCDENEGTCSGHSCNCDFAVHYDDALGGGTMKYELYSASAAQCGSDYRPNTGVSQVLATLKHMATVAGLKRTGTLHADALLPAQVKDFEIPNVAGQGVVYNVLVTDTYQTMQHPDVPPETFQSVYTPLHNFGCLLAGEAQRPGGNLPSCGSLSPYGLMAVRIVTALLGLFLALFGHLCYKTQVFLYSFMLWTGITYVILQIAVVDSHLHAISFLYIMVASSAAGIGGGLLFYGLWYFFDLTSTYLVFSGCIMGVPMSGFVFATPLGDVSIFANPFNYGMAFACFVVVWPVILLLKGRLLSIVSTSVVGSYCILLVCDFFIGSDFDAIVGNVFRRAIDKDFAKAYTGHYFGEDFNGCTNVTANIAFFAAWFGLSLICGLLQALVIAKNAAVPHSPYRRGNRSDARGRELRSLLPSSSSVQGGASRHPPGWSRSVKRAPADVFESEESEEE